MLGVEPPRPRRVSEPFSTDVLERVFVPLPPFMYPGCFRHSPFLQQGLLLELAVLERQLFSNKTEEENEFRRGD